MSLDPEMEIWQKEWSKNDSVVSVATDEIVAAAIRHQRWSHLALAANIVFGLLLLAGSLVIAKRTAGREVVLWAACVWTSTLIASYFALEWWRKSRLIPIESVADYIRFHRKRAKANRWMVRTGVILLCVQDAIACLWLTVDLFRSRISLSRFGVAMAVLVVLSVVWIYLFRRTWKRAAVVLQTESDHEDEPGESTG